MKIHVTYEFENEDEMRAHIGGETRTASVVVASQDVTPAAPAPAEPEVTAERDGDGMAWNPDYHSTPKSFTEDGMWRSKRGKAEEAKAARAQFKAAGGGMPATIAAPAMPVAAPAMPVAAPAMPVAAPAAILPPPVDFGRLVGKITGMMQRGSIGGDSVAALYVKVGATSSAQFETNESLRAALFTELCQIEPELS